MVEAGGERLIFDFGRGSTIRLFEKKIPIGSITAHFITHLHSDHVVGLPDMWLTGWIGTPYGSRKTPMVIYGPKGTAAMTENLTKAFSEDIRIRIDDENYPPSGVAFDAHAAAASVAKLAAVQFVIDDIDVDGQASRKARDKCQQRLSVRFTGGGETQHSLKTLE